MMWTDFYLVCFLVGFALSFLSFVLGSFDFHLHFHAHGDLAHLPHLHVHVGDAFHAGAHGVHGGHPAPANAGGGHGLTTEPELSWFNFGSITAFLAWFGGTGYLLSRFSGFWVWLSFTLAILAGLAGGAIMFWFVAKVLMKHDKALDPLDYEMVGVLGTLTMPIREGGTGEMVFSQEGSRRCAGARSELGEVIAKGTEVVVTRYEKGIAYVRRWDELANESTTTAGNDDRGEA
jgi:membrane protein implicated in regulation of membrane protease activity